MVKLMAPEKKKTKWKVSEFSFMEERGVLIKNYWVYAIRNSGKKGTEWYTPHRQWDDRNTWVKSAQFAAKHGVMFLKFIAFIVTVYRPARPNLMCSEKVLKRFLAEDPGEQALEVQNLAVFFRAQQAIVRQAVAHYQTDENLQPREEPLSRRAIQLGILVNDRWELCPLFRYCLAVSENFPKRIKQLHMSALAQYLENMEGYDAAWRGWLPESLCETARRMCSPQI